MKKTIFSIYDDDKTANVALYKDENGLCELRQAFGAGSVSTYLSEEKINEMIEQITANWYS